jgi:H+/gluconate symporter-like permease
VTPVTEEWTPSGRLRPSRWAWTTATATVLLAVVLFIVVTLASDLAQRHPSSNVALEILELGLAIGLVPSIAVWIVAWKARKRGEEVDETMSAALGFLAVVVLVLGVAGALLQWPARPKTRLVIESTLAVLGAALLAASVWVRHIPRPWWPRSDVSG